MSAEFEEAYAAIQRVELLMVRARLIAKTPPHRQNVNEQFAQLDLDETEAILSWPVACGGYDDAPALETEEIRFPVGLLFLDEADFATALRNAELDYDKKIAAQVAENEARREQGERATLAALKAKYGE